MPLNPKWFGKGTASAVPPWDELSSQRQACPLFPRRISARITRFAVSDSGANDAQLRLAIWCSPFAGVPGRLWGRQWDVSATSSSTGTGLHGFTDSWECHTGAGRHFSERADSSRCPKRLYWLCLGNSQRFADRSRGLAFILFSHTRRCRHLYSRRFQYRWHRTDFSGRNRRFRLAYGERVSSDQYKRGSSPRSVSRHRWRIQPRFL